MKLVNRYWDSPPENQPSQTSTSEFSSENEKNKPYYITKSHYFKLPDANTEFKNTKIIKEWTFVLSFLHVSHSKWNALQNHRMTLFSNGVV